MKDWNESPSRIALNTLLGLGCEGNEANLDLLDEVIRQEQKQLLEQIKREIDDDIKTQPTDYTYGEGTYEGLVRAKRVIDKHINN